MSACRSPLRRPPLGLENTCDRVPISVGWQRDRKLGWGAALVGSQLKGTSAFWDGRTTPGHEKCWANSWSNHRAMLCRVGAVLPEWLCPLSGGPVPTKLEAKPGPTTSEQRVHRVRRRELLREGPSLTHLFTAEGAVRRSLRETVGGWFRSSACS